MMAGSNYLPVRPDWLAQVREDALDPELPIFDAHHHLWDRPGWRYLLPELLADIRDSGHRVVGTGFMQCQTMYRNKGPAALRPVGETEFVAGLAECGAAAASGVQPCAAIVGHADLRLGDAVHDVLLAHVEAGRGRFRGIRHIVSWDADASLLNPLSAGPPGLLADAAFRTGFARLAPFGLMFEAWLFHPQLPELTALARAFPDTVIVLNHCGGILGAGRYAGRREEVFHQWAASVRDLATCPNVHVKLGGLGMRINGFGFELGTTPPGSVQLADTWRPYVETCIEAFGTVRCLFESNFPVDKGSYAYGTVWNAFKRLTQHVDAHAKQALFRDNALALYRIESSRQPGTLTVNGME